MQCEGWVGQRKGRVKLWQGRGKARQFKKKIKKKEKGKANARITKTGKCKARYK